jgi:hypothetical protein
MASASPLSSGPVVQSKDAQERGMQETPRKGSDTRERILDVVEAVVLEKGSPPPLRSRR